MSEVTYKGDSNSSSRWLIPLLLLLLVGTIAWYALSRNNNTNNTLSTTMSSSSSSNNQGMAFSNPLPAVTSAVGATINTANLAAAGTITTIGSFFTQPNPSTASSGSMANSTIGQQVQLPDVLVNRVTGDKTFIISSDGTNKVYVALAENLNSGTAEQALQVKDGQRVRITGVVKAMPSVEMIANSWKLAQAEIDIAAKYSYYIEATQVTVLVDTSAAAQ